MEKIKLGRRLGSMLVDYFILCAILGLLGISVSIFNLISREYLHVNLDWIKKWFISFIIITIGFNKDFFRGKSIAKRVFGLVIVNNTGGSATRLQCFIRNLTFVLAPLEIIVLIFSRQRRLGDLIAGTKIETSETEEISSIIYEIKVGLKNKNSF